MNGTITTYFVGAHYEVTGSTVTKYYYAGAQRIAMRTNGTLQYLLGDHLGSTSLVTDATGNNTIETGYKAWDEVRYSSGNMPTKYTYTGQYSYVSDFGLHYYNARWYDSSLGRFAQPDSITPDGVQGYDRYAYVSNNPLRYTDPTGHMETQGCGDGKDACAASELEIAINAQKLAELEYDPSGQKQEQNAAVAEFLLYNVPEILASTFIEPVDWGLTAYHCINGDCSALALLGLLPLVPSGAGRIFRVEGIPNTRLIISEAGDVRIIGNSRLHINFGDTTRALEFYFKRLEQGMPGVELKSFLVDDQLLHLTQKAAVSQRFGKLFPNAPQIVDATKAANQFGFPKSWFSIIESFIIPGSGRTILPDE